MDTDSQFTPAFFWRERLAQVERDLDRIQALLDDNLIKQEAGQGGKFGQRLGPLKIKARQLRQREDAGATPAPVLWQDLYTLMSESRALCIAQLELLGGIGIVRRASNIQPGLDGGFAERAKQWLIFHRDRLGLDKQISVIVGQGPRWDAEVGIVRLGFPDWDLWHLPLLARALGLMAAEPGSPYYSPLNKLGERSFQQSRAALPPDPTQFRVFLQQVFADMLATVLIGPAYAMAVLALEIDYCNPDQLELPGPDMMEVREAAPRYLPAPVQRAAAILATLKAMNTAADQAGREVPFKPVVADLQEIWHSVIRSAGRVDSLDAVTAREQVDYDSLFADVIEPLASIAMEQTEKTWQQAQLWQKAFRTGQMPDDCFPEMTALVGAIWRHRLKNPDQARNALALANTLLGGSHSIVSLESAKVPWETAIAGARLEQLDERAKRVEGILRDEAISAPARAAVAGRFFRLLSELDTKLEFNRLMLQSGDLRASSWGRLNESAAHAQPILREALEFLGGWLVHQNGLDREPANVSRQAEKGVSVCDLADALLHEYAQQTGVNWSARTVLGSDPFLSTDTDVIRVRFPDWSPWNLPLMAHEFGHVVARATPTFLQYQGEQYQLARERYPYPERANELYTHFEEYFADIFATYTFGPAFAYDVILLQFNPAQAYAWRGGHPYHMLRVDVILQTLREMNDKARGEYPFTNVLAQLEKGWFDAVTTCQAAPEDEAKFNVERELAKRWGRYIYRLIDRSYRLGAFYTLERWGGAREMSRRLLRLPAPHLDELRQLGGTVKIGQVSLGDLLNALWYARAGHSESITILTAAAHQLAREYLGG